MRADDPLPEYDRNHARVVTELLKREWSLGPQRTPNILWGADKQAVNSRNGVIYIQYRPTDETVSTMDYRTVDQIHHLTVKFTHHNEDAVFGMMAEARRILYGYRRTGIKGPLGYSEIRIRSTAPMEGLLGHYIWTMSVELREYCKPIGSFGFGGSY